MNGLKGITELQRKATLREYAQALKSGNVSFAHRIKDANSKFITTLEFKNATV
jgi:hypothetical protein